MSTLGKYTVYDLKHRLIKLKCCFADKTAKLVDKQKYGKTKAKHMFSRISYTLNPVNKAAVWNGVLEAHSMWAFPEEGSVKKNLEDMYKDHGRFKKRAKELQRWVCKEFTEDKMYKKYIDIINSDEDLDIVIV